MADRIPLILNTNANQIQEMPSGDTLDLTGSNINGVGIITASQISSRITGNVDIQAGIITATTIDCNGDLDVDGHINFDNLSIAGVSTFAGNADFSSGVDVTGTVTATTFSGSGASLTNLNASNIASGTVPTARLGSGTANNTTFLRGDSTFQTVTTDLVNDSSPQLGGDLESNGNNIKLGDSSSSNDDRIQIGAATNGDMELFHDGNHSYIMNNTGNLYIGAGNVFINNAALNEAKIKAFDNGAVELYHDNTKRLETRANGTQVTGTLLAGSSSISAENSTYVLQAAAPSQAYISAYRGDTGTNLANHGFHFGIDVTSHNLLGRENKPMYFYTNDTHACTIDTNQHFVPAGNNLKDLGTTSLRWRNIYTNDLNLSNKGSTNSVDNTWGDYTIQEGESDLFLITNRRGHQ